MKNAFKKKKRKYGLAAKYAYPKLKRPQAGQGEIPQAAGYAVKGGTWMNGKIYVCHLSRKEAAELGMEEAYWESYRRNEECASAVKKAIAEHYDGWNLEDGCAKEVIDRFGYERVDFILAYNIRQMVHDGRVSQKNKEWAEGISVPLSTGFKGNWLIQNHPALA